ncbi:hypothetical protein D3C86_1695180 [compost metagenome]
MTDTWRLTGMQQIPAFGILAVPTQFGQAGDAPHFAADIEVLLQQLRGGDDFLQD